MSDDTSEELAKVFGLLISDVSRLLRKRFEQVARERGLGLTRAQAAVVLHLSRGEGINQVTLAQLMELEPITLVRLLDRLETAGLVERRPDPTDRRARILYLTPASRPLLARIQALADEVRAMATIGFSADERDAAVRAMSRMKVNLLKQIQTPQPDEELRAHG